MYCTAFTFKTVQDEQDFQGRVCIYFKLRNTNHYLGMFHIIHFSHEMFCLQRYLQFIAFNSSSVLWINFRPAYPAEEPEEEEITEDDAELTLSKLEEDVAVGLFGWFWLY